MSSGIECLHCRGDVRFCNCVGQQRSNARWQAEHDAIIAVLKDHGVPHSSDGRLPWTVEIRGAELVKWLNKRGHVR